MINVKLSGHDYRYELFQILFLFYDKSQIAFESADNDYNFESILNTEESFVKAIIFDKNKERIEESLKVNLEDKKSIKNAIKMTALKCLEKYTGVNIPWGILVGIRPTKIAHECFKKGLSGERSEERR